MLVVRLFYPTHTHTHNSVGRIWILVLGKERKRREKWHCLYGMEKEGEWERGNAFRMWYFCENKGREIHDMIVCGKVWFVKTHGENHDGFEESGMEGRSENTGWDDTMIVLCVMRREMDFCVNVKGVHIIILEGLNMCWEWRVISGDVEIQTIEFGCWDWENKE